MATTQSRSYGRPAGEERAHVLVRVERDEESDVSLTRRPDRDAHGRPAAVAAARRGSRTAPEASATPARISARPTEHRRRDLLVEDQRAVDEREAGHQVRDEREPRRAVEGEHPEQNQLRERGAEERQGEQRGRRLQRRRRGGKLDEREGRQDQPAGEHRSCRKHRPGRAGHRPLAVDAGGRIGERREDDRERAEDREVAALRVDAGDDRDAEDPDRETERAHPRQPLVRQEAEDEECVEDRHRGLHDGGEAGVDVLLAPRDQPERQRRVEDAEHEAVLPGRPELREGTLASEPPDEVADQRGGGDERPEGHHRRRLDLVDGDLDEEVRRPPDRGERQEHGPVAVHRVRLAASARRARRLLPTAPVPSATPQSTSASPASATLVTSSSRKTAP